MYTFTKLLLGPPGRLKDEYGGGMVDSSIAVRHRTLSPDGSEEKAASSFLVCHEQDSSSLFYTREGCKSVVRYLRRTDEVLPLLSGWG